MIVSSLCIHYGCKPVRLLGNLKISELSVQNKYVSFVCSRWIIICLKLWHCLQIGPIASAREKHIATSISDRPNCKTYCKSSIGSEKELMTSLDIGCMTSLDATSASWNRSMYDLLRVWDSTSSKPAMTPMHPPLLTAKGVMSLQEQDLFWQWSWKGITKYTEWTCIQVSVSHVYANRKVFPLNLFCSPAPFVAGVRAFAAATLQSVGRLASE